MFDPVWILEDGAGGAQSRSGRRSSGFFSVAPASFTLSAQTKWRLVVSTPLAGGREGWRCGNISKGGWRGRWRSGFPGQCCFRTVSELRLFWAGARRRPASSSSSDDGVTHRNDAHSVSCLAEYYSTWLSTWRDSEAQGSSALMKWCGERGKNTQ